MHARHACAPAASIPSRWQWLQPARAAQERRGAVAHATQRSASVVPPMILLPPCTHSLQMSRRIVSGAPAAAHVRHFSSKYGHLCSHTHAEQPPLGAFSPMHLKQVARVVALSKFAHDAHCSRPLRRRWVPSYASPRCFPMQLRVR